MRIVRQVILEAFFRTSMKLKIEKGIDLKELAIV